jgi:hypothetical protein
LRDASLKRARAAARSRSNDAVIAAIFDGANDHRLI